MHLCLFLTYFRDFLGFLGGRAFTPLYLLYLENFLFLTIISLPVLHCLAILPSPILFTTIVLERVQIFYTGIPRVVVFLNLGKYFHAN